MRLRKFFAALALGLALAVNASAGDFFAVARWHHTQKTSPAHSPEEASAVSLPPRTKPAQKTSPAEATSGDWTVSRCLQDTAGVATLSFEGRGECCYVKKAVAVSSVRSGDSFVFTFPVEDLPEGAVVDFGATLNVTAAGGPERWVCEVYDGRSWRSDDGPVSFTVKWYKGGNPTTYMHSFTLRKAVRKEVRVRLRSLDDSTDPDAKLYFQPVQWIPAYLAVSTIPVKDRKSLVILGNSFTYFGGTAFALREIARSQGRTLDITINLKGGQNFGQHLKLEKSMEAISSHAPYDIALLQNSSPSAAQYAADRENNRAILEDAVTLASRIREHSPKARLVLERTWSYSNKGYRGFGSYEAFDEALQNGSEEISAAMKAELSPIGKAFILGRERGLRLYWKDNFHQNFTGAYLKACVNYLYLFGEPFTDGVSDYTLDPDTAALCRAIATEVVMPD